MASDDDPMLEARTVARHLARADIRRQFAAAALTGIMSRDQTHAVVRRSTVIVGEAPMRAAVDYGEDVASESSWDKAVEAWKAADAMLAVQDSIAAGGDPLGTAQADRSEPSDQDPVTPQAPQPDPQPVAQGPMARAHDLTADSGFCRRCFASFITMTDMKTEHLDHNQTPCYIRYAFDSDLFVYSVKTVDINGLVESAATLAQLLCSGWRTVAAGDKLTIYCPEGAWPVMRAESMGLVLTREESPF